MKEYLKWRQKLTDYVTQLVHIQEQEAITIEDLERIDKTKELLRFMSMQTLGDVCILINLSSSFVLSDRKSVV